MSTIKQNEFPPEVSEDPNTGIKQIKINSKIEILKSRFYFHDILKSSSGFSNHFIIEDLEVDPEDQDEDPDAQLFYYLKQTVYRNKAEFLYALSYYKKLYQYCQAKFAKSDIIRLHYIYNSEVEAENYYELAVVFDFGEPDRIDIDHIESQHINKFLKNICILLNDIKKFDQLYHSNIAVHNIVLVNNELKLSGFKPRFLFNPEYVSWKVELAKRSGYHRLDLFLIGLIWLRFLGLKQIDEIADLHKKLAQINELVQKAVLQATEHQRKEIVMKLVDYDDFPDVDLDEVILDFDEYYILENIKSLEKQRQSDRLSNPLLVSSSLVKDDQPIEFYFDSKDHQNYPSEQFESDSTPIHKSDSKDANLFMRPYRESLPNLLRGGPQDPSQLQQRDKEDFMRINGDFTLKDENSVDHFVPYQHDNDLDIKDELIAITDQRTSGQQRSPSADLKRESADRNVEMGMRLRINSEKKFGIRTNDRQSPEVMRKGMSQENLILAKKKIIEEEEEDRDYVEHNTFNKENEVLGENKFKSNIEEDENLEEAFDLAIEREVEETEIFNEADIAKKLMNRTDENREVPKLSSKANLQKQSNRSLKKLEEKFKYVDEFADPNDVLLKSIREKKHQLEEKRPRNVELTEEQKLRVQKDVEEDLEKLLENQIVKIKRGKEEILQKEIERKEQEKILKEKIEKKLTENLKKKKKDLENAAKKDKEPKDADNEKRNPLSPNPEPQRSLKIIKAEKEGEHIESKSKLEPTTNIVKTPKKPKEKDSIEEMNKKLSKQFDLSTHEQRKNIFGQANQSFEPEPKNFNFKKTTENPDNFIEVFSEIKTSYIPKPPENYSDLLKDIPSDQFNTLSDSVDSNRPELHGQVTTNQTFALIGNKKQSPFIQSLESSQDVERLKQQLKDSMKKEQSSIEQNQHNIHTNPTINNNNRIFDEFPSLDYSSEYSTPGKQALNETDPHLPSFTSNRNLANMISGDKPNMTFGQIQSNYNTQSNYDTHKVPENEPETAEDDFNYRIMVTKRLFLLQKFTEAREYLEGLRNKFGIPQEIELLKLLSLIHFKMKDLPKAKETLISALQILRDHTDLEQAPELLKSILTNIAIIDFENKCFEEVILILKNKAFEEPGAYSTGYFQLLGDAYFGIEDYREAFVAYDSELKSLISLDLSEKTVNEIFGISVKIVISLSLIKETEVISKFFKNMRTILTSAEKQEEALKGQEQLENVSWRFLIHVLAFTELSNSSELTLLLLKEFSQSEISENGCTLNENDKEKLLQIIVKTVLWLKGVSDKGMRQTSILGLILWGLDLIQTMESTDTTNRHYLVLLFNKGLFLFEEEEFEMAKDSFDLCLEVYYLSDDAPLEDLLLILFNVGVCLQKMDNFDEASFYFEKVLQNNVGESAILVKTTKVLARIYYRLEIFSKCHETLKNWILSNYKTNTKSSFFKYLYMFYHCAKIMNSPDLPTTTDAIKWYITHNKHVKSSFFVHAYFNLTEEAIGKGDFKESESYLHTIKALFRQDDSNGFQKEFVSDINLMNAKFGQEKFQEALDMNKQLQKIMQNNPSEFLGSEDTIMNFLINFLFIIISKLEIKDDENFHNINERQETIQRILKFKEDRQIFDKVYELIKLQQNLLTSFVSETEICVSPLEDTNYYESKPINSTNQVLPESQRKLSQSLQKSLTSNEHWKEPSFNSRKKAESNAGLKSENVTKQHQMRISEEPELDEQTKEHSSNAQKRPRRINSEEILKKSNLSKKTKCSCFEFTRKNAELCTITDNFFKQLKQVTLSAAASYLESSLIKMEDSLKEKLLHLEKFKYIKRMVKFFLAKKDKEKTIDRTKLFEFYDSIIDSKDLCVHDFKKIIFFLEIFSEIDINYLSSFLTFLDQEHKSLAKLIFNQLFLNAFNHRFDKLMINVYKRINGNRQSNVENFSLMHCLEFKPILSQVPNDNASSFKHLSRPRYGLLGDKSNHSMFVKYLSPVELVNFYIRMEIQTALANMAKKDFTNSVALIKNLCETFNNLFRIFSIEKLTHRFLLYELYTVIYFLNFSEPEKTAEAIIQLLNLFEDKLAENVLFHFSIASSAIGNIFFKFKLFEASIKAKLIAFETMKRIREVEMIFPVYIKEIDPKAHMFAILSFMMVNQIELERLDPAKAFLDKLNAISFDSLVNNLEKKILTAFFEFVTDNLKSSKASIEAAQKSFEKIVWTDSQKDVFKAIIDKIVLNVAKRTLKGEDISRELSAYESSIARLYK